MKTRLIVAVVFFCAVCRFTEGQLLPLTPLNANITRSGCGVTKLCVSNASDFFSSTQFSNGVLTVEIFGTTSGYVALGVTPSNNFTQQLTQGTAVFVCGNNNTNAFFEIASQSGSVLTPVNVTTINITAVQGNVTTNLSLVQCSFSIVLNSTLLGSTTGAVQLPYIVTILNGSTNGTQLGSPNTVFNSSTPLDLANPKSNVPNPPPLNITRNGCSSSKLCLSLSSTCDPSGSSSCFFSSVQLNNKAFFFFELSGTTAGYVALGLTKQSSTVVFVCANNSTANSFQFLTAIKNSSSLTLSNVATVYSTQGTISTSQPLIQCIFNTTTSFTTSSNTKADDTSYQVIIMNGTINGTQLGDPNTVYDSGRALDLSNPAALNHGSTVIASLCTNVLAVLLSALTLHLL